MRSFWKSFLIILVLTAAALCVAEIVFLELGLFRSPRRQYEYYSILVVPVSLLFSAAVSAVTSRAGPKPEAPRGGRLEELEREIDTLREQAERREEFIGGVAHELKTPLTAIIGYADLLRSRDMPSKQRFTAAGYIFSEGKRLESLSKKLMDIIVLGRNEPELRRIDAGYLIRDVAAVAAPSTGGDGMLLSIYWDKGEVMVDYDLFKTLLLNILDNARKASRHGQEIKLYGKSEDGGYSFYVQDSGRGMSADESRRIVEPFYVTDKSRAKASGGVGLGLALCQKISDLHGAELSFDSTPGQGTTVRVFLRGGESD